MTPIQLFFFRYGIVAAFLTVMGVGVLIISWISVALDDRREIQDMKDRMQKFYELNKP